MIEENFRFVVYFIAVLFVVMMFTSAFVAQEWQQEKVQRLRDLRIVMAYVSRLDTLSIPAADLEKLPPCRITIYDSGMRRVREYSRGFPSRQIGKRSVQVGITQRVPRVIGGRVYYFEIAV